MFVLVSTLLAAAAQPMQAQTYSVLYSFCSQPNCADGGGLFGPLVQDKDGNLYGTTSGGGVSCGVQGGCGTVFEVTPTGTEKVLHSFTGGSDGNGPWGGLVFGNKTNAVDQKGGLNLYGTTTYGGAYGYGTVFEVTSSGTERVLYSFTGGADGRWPYAGLLPDSRGNLYGTASSGGDLSCDVGQGNGCGTVFELTPGGTETVLYTFTGGGVDGALPIGPLIRDAQGNLYGTTNGGGPYPCFLEGCGTVFELTPAGAETTLYAFTGGADDGNPYGGLVRDAHGNLYGTTAQFSDSYVYPGTVFELTSTGTETVLHTFCSQPNCTDGAAPYATLVRDPHGNLYGTTTYGGAYNAGTVFEVTSSRKEKVLYSFTGGADGGVPYAGLLRDAHGNLYGTTYIGGSYGGGVVFKVTP